MIMIIIIIIVIAIIIGITQLSFFFLLLNYENNIFSFRRIRTKFKQLLKIFTIKR